MTTGDLAPILNEAKARYRAGRLSRRQALGVLGALGLSASAAPWLFERDATATATGKAATGGHAGHIAAAQEGAPPPMATPQLGERADGSRVWRVIAGGGSPEELIEAVAFFPGEITINAGDAIFFEIRGPHNVHFLSGQEAPPFVVPVPQTGTPAGGPPTLILNPEVFFPTGGTSYDGTGVVNSGVALGPAEPFVLTFTTPGSYDYVCSLHLPVMRGKVVVQEAGSPYPAEQADYDRMAEEQTALLIERGRATAAEYEGADPVADGSPTATGGRVHEVTAGFVEDQVDVLRFLPEQVTIRAGETVRWTVRSAPVTPHVVTFLGGGPAVEFLVPIEAAGGPPTLSLNPEVVAPVGGATYDGRGFANSGLLGGPDGEVTYELTFQTPGTYRYYCPIHADPEGGMIGDVIVE